MMGSSPQRFGILVVCTGNICRSPMAQTLLSHRLDELLGAAAGDFVVTSAGTHGMVGYPIEPDAVAVLRDLGSTPPTFAARELVAALVEEADLILGATREHRSAVARLVPRATQRSFTILEFARLVAAVDLAEAAALEPVARAREVVEKAGRLRGVVRAQSPADDDIDDPYRRAPEAFTRAGRQIAEAVEVIAAALAS